MARFRTLVIGFVALLIGGGQAGAQELPAVQRSSIATVPVPIPPGLVAAARATETELTYEVRPRESVRTIGRPRGVVPERDTETRMIPLSFSLAADVEAGPTTIAVVHFAVGTATDSSVVDVDVVRHLDLDLELEAVDSLAVRGGHAEVIVTVRNGGNAPDSALLRIVTSRGLVLPDSIRSIEVGAFGITRDTVRFLVTRELSVGATPKVQVMLRSGERERVRQVNYLVVSSLERGDGLVALPTSVFAGSSVQGLGGDLQASPVLAIRGGGRVGRTTSVRFALTAREQFNAPVAFRGLGLGPKYQLGITSARYGVTVGEVFAPTALLLGTSQLGEGAVVELRPGFGEIQAQVTRPLAPDGSRLGGHSVVLRAKRNFRFGEAGVLVADMERSNLIGSTASRVQTGLFHAVYEPPGQHRAYLDVGPMRVTDSTNGQARTGLAVDARYTFQTERMVAQFIGQTAPATTAELAVPPTNVTALIQGTLMPGLRPFASFTHQRAEAFARRLGRSHDTGEAGIRFGNRSQLTTAVFARSYTFDLLQADRVTRERGLRLGANLQSGAFFVDLQSEVGKARDDLGSGVAHNHRGNVYWNHSSGFVRAGLSYTSDLRLPGTMMFDFGATIRPVESVEIYGSATVDALDYDLGEFAYFQLSTEVALQHDLSVYVGVESTASLFNTSGARFALGVRKGLPLPLPIRRKTGIQGVVFADLNGNGRQDDDEPGIDGVRIHQGGGRAVTHSGGMFIIDSDEIAPVRIDPATVPPGHLMPPDVVPTGSSVKLPLLPVGGVTIRVFADRNGNGIRDVNEADIPDLTVRLRAGARQEWILITDETGAASVSSVRVGTYQAEVPVEELPSWAVRREGMVFEIDAGEHAEIELPISRKEVRFNAPRRISQAEPTDTAVVVVAEDAAPAEPTPAPVPDEADVRPLELESEAITVTVAPRAIPVAPRALPLVTAEQELEYVERDMGGVPVVTLGALAVVDLSVPRLDERPEAEMVQIAPVRVTPIDRPEPLVVAAVDAEPEAPVTPIAADALAPAEQLEPEFLGALRVETFYDANGNGIRDEGEEDAAGVQVTITHGDEEWRFRTGTDGATNLTPVPVGIYIVSAFSRAFADLGAQPGIFPIRVESVRQTVIRLPVPVRVDRFLADDDDDDD